MLYKHIRETYYNNVAFSGVFDMLHVLNLDTAIMQIGLFTGLTRSIIDNYLNTMLKEKMLVADMRDSVSFDRQRKCYILNTNNNVAALSDALYAGLLKADKLFEVMTQENLNIVTFQDVDTDVYGEKARTLNYDKVEITLAQGERLNTIVNGVRERLHSSQDDVTLRQVSGFNSSGFNDAEKTTFTEGSYTDQDASSTDTITDAAVTDNNTTKAREDTDVLATYTDTHTRTRHYILPTNLYFEMQKEMAAYGVYDAIKKAVSDVFTINMWGV